MILTILAFLIVGLTLLWGLGMLIVRGRKSENYYSRFPNGGKR